MGGQTTKPKICKCNKKSAGWDFPITAFINSKKSPESHYEYYVFYKFEKQFPLQPDFLKLFSVRWWMNVPYFVSSARTRQSVSPFCVLEALEQCDVTRAAPPSSVSLQHGVFGFCAYHWSAYNKLLFVSLLFIIKTENTVKQQGRNRPTKRLHPSIWSCASVNKAPGLLECTTCRTENFATRHLVSGSSNQ